MIDILVNRGSPVRDGGDITDPLLSSLAPALARGQQEIDSATKTRPVQVVAVFRPGMETGQSVEVQDALQGKSWRGKITAIDHAIEGVFLSSTVRISKVD